MDDIKIEIEINKPMCHGCLSVDRILQHLNQNTDLFFMLINNSSLTHNDSTFINILLCWECNALLRRIKEFQMQIQKAQDHLERKQILLEKKFDNVNSLSSLKVIKINVFDVTYNTEVEVKPEHSAEEYLDFNVLEVKPECTNEEFSDFKEEYDDIGDIEDTTNETHVKKIKKEKNIKSQKKYGKERFKPHTSEFDLSKSDLYISEVTFNIQDLECFRKEQFSMFKPKKFSNRMKKFVDMKCKDIKNVSKSKEPYKCSHCSVEFSTLESLEDHWREFSVVAYRCDLCRCHFNFRSELHTHMSRAHAHVYTCAVCGINFSSLREYYNHYRDLHKYLVCDHCGKLFSCRRSIEKHIRCNHLPAKCEFCPRSFDKYEQLRKHKRRYHMTPATGDKLEMCYCVECNIQFPHTDAYKRHLRTAVAHTPKKPTKVPCPDCGKIFSRTVYMNNHYRLVHVKETKHYCQLCDKYFINAFALRTHRKYVHEKAEKPRVKICDVCGKGFHTTRTLVNHRRTHTGERPYRCPHCPAAFAQITAQKTHARTQHKYLA